ncbi:hypothetical protein D3C85_1830180 [compost metagenome]
MTGIEIEFALELAEGAIHPRPHLVVGETDGAGGGVHVGVFDGMGTGQNARHKDDSHRDET